jgi:class 3 adenylate cyclase
VTAHSNRTATVLFTDLVGSTELLSRLGESSFDDLRRAHFTALRTSIEGTGGTEVKTTGDGLYERLSAPALLARTHLEWAHMLMVRREAGDAERARHLLGHALTTARQLCLSNVERRTVALLDSSSGNHAVASGTDVAEG